TAYMLAKSLPYWPIEPSLIRNPWHGFQLDLLRCLWAVLPAASLWGASFPLALASVASSGRDAGRLVGGVYAANTVRPILGALVFSLSLVGRIGTQHSQQFLIAVAAAAALAALVPLLWTNEPQQATASPSAAGAVGRTIALAAALIVAFALAQTVPPTPGALIA